MTAEAGLTPGQADAREEYESYAQLSVAPFADGWDRDGRVPADVVADLGHRGYLGLTVPAEYGGADVDAVTFGLLNAEIGRACSSVRSLLTVHGMVVRAVRRWCGAVQRERWLPRLATGAAVGAFAMTEPGAGSDVASLECTARRSGDGYRLDGTKQWVTFGQLADVFLVFARLDGAPAAFLVERDAPGLRVRPVEDVLGTRASMVAELELTDCRVPGEALTGRPGFGLAVVGADALEVGRYSVAWGCAGLLRACLDASLDHADSRVQFGARLREHQLVQRMLSDMATDADAGRLLCLQAGWLRDTGDPRAVHATWMAKYFTSTRAFRSASAAVQVHGARGCASGAPVQRYLRDAKVMEIIEGSTELQQSRIAGSAYEARTAVAAR